MRHAKFQKFGKYMYFYWSKLSNPVLFYLLKQMVATLKDHCGYT